MSESRLMVEVLTAPLPGVRSGLLAAWFNAFIGDVVTADDAAARAAKLDDVAVVAGAPLGELAGIEIDVALHFAALRRDGVTRLELLLPVPGDVRGTPGPSPFTTSALEAGEGLLTRGAAARSGLVPEVNSHGPEGDTATVCHWRSLPVEQPELLALPMLTVAEAEKDLRLALLDSTKELARLEVARWSPEVAAPLAQLREDTRRGRGAARDLPPGHPRAARDLLERADPLARVLQLAEATPGMTVTGAEDASRSGVLRSLAAAVRRARLAAYNAA